VEEYGRFADLIAADIAAGRLRSGQQLPPQRTFARRHHIAASTAARVYGELVRRGLAVGEVGRGTFVRPARTVDQVDLEFNFPVLPEQAALLAPALERALRHDVFEQSLRGGPTSAATREAAADLLARAGWRPDPGSLLFAAGGRQAIAAALAALVPPGGRLGVESLTYPVLKAIAAQLRIELVPLPMDADGLVPRRARVDALYVQPTLHNPLGITMSTARREEIAGLGLPIIEDGVNSFLDESLAPLAALASDRVVVIDSLSKRLAPGLTVGFVAAPGGWADRIAATLRSGTWGSAAFALDAATRWILDGSAARIAAAKRLDAAHRQELVRQRLPAQGNPRAYHCWLPLPSPWQADTFVAAAARRGISVTPAAAFAVVPAQAPNAVRLALGSPPLDALAGALDTLASLLAHEPDLVEG
jgi:DNA-binding transcriptional MocR family regulator